MANARAIKPGAAADVGVLNLQNDGTPVVGGPFNTLDADDGSVMFADLGGAKASVRSAGGTFPAVPPGTCKDIGVPADVWVMETLTPSVSGEANVAYSPSLKLFCILEGTTAYTSPDGRTWTRRTTALADVEFQRMVWADTLNRFVAIGFSDNTLATLTIKTSPDGVTWTTTSTSLGTANAQVNGLAWSHDLGVLAAVGVNEHTNTPLLLSSTDGTTWTDHSVASGNPDWDTASAFDVCWSSDNGFFLLVGTASTSFPQGLTATSTDGATWSPATAPNASDVTSWQAVDYSTDLGIFAMIGGNGGGTTGPLIAISFDGSTWYTRTTPSDADGNSGTGGMKWSSILQLFLAGGTFNVASYELMTSPDGDTWTATTVQGLTQQIVEDTATGTLIGTSPRATSGIGNYLRYSPAQVPCNVFTKAVSLVGISAAPSAPSDGNTLYTDPTTGHPTNIAADGTVTDLLAGASGGSVQSVTVTLTDAQIKSLPTTPVQLVVAPGAGKYLLPTIAAIRCDSTAGIYTNIDTSCFLTVALGNDVVETLQEVINNAGASFGQATNLLTDGGPGGINTQILAPDFVVDAGTGLTTSATIGTGASQPDNLPIMLICGNGGSGNLGGGNAGNSMRVTVSYVVVTL